jgi:hypothetical protein
MRRFLLGCLVGSLIVTIIVAVPQKQRESIAFGTTDLNLGMSEDATIKTLAEAGYVTRKLDVPKALQDKGVTSMWNVDGKGANQESIGLVTFGSGRLTTAQKSLYEEGDAVDFARRLYFGMRDLELEGNIVCTIETKSAEVPDFSQKNGQLRCGGKSIVIELQKFQKQSETVQLTEALGDAR